MFKKYFVLNILFFLSVSLAGQNLILSQKFGGSGDNRVYKSVIDNQNNIYILGFFTGTVHADIDYSTYGTGQDVYISKYDSNGNLVWFKQIGSTDADDYTDAIVLSPDQATVAITGGFNGGTCNFGDGYTLSNATPGASDAFLLILNATNGSVNNVKNIAYGDGWQRTQDIKFDKNSNLVILGFVQGDTYTTYFSPTISFVCSGVQNYFILQLDPSLNINWVKLFTGNDGNNKLFSLDVDNSGYYIAGTNKNTLNLDIATLNSQSGTQDMFLYKTDFNGNGRWVRSIKGSGNDVSQYATCDQLGHIYISGYYASTDLKVDSTATLQSLRTVPNRGSNDIFFAKYDTTGTLIWFDDAGSTGDDRLTRLNTNGQYIVIAGQYGGQMTFGQQTITPRGGIDAFGVVHDANDNPLYAISAGGSGDDVNQTCLIDNQGNYFFIGQTKSPAIYFTATDSLENPTAPNRDVYIAKYNKASVSIVKTDISCSGGSNGSANAVPKGAVITPVTYAWTKQGDASFTRNTASITGLSAGRYYVQATDAINYVMTDSVDLTDPTPVAVTLAGTTNVTCYNENNGGLDITPSGGSGSYTYAWTAASGSGLNATAQDQTTLTAGVFGVVVTDTKGCQASLLNMPVTQPSQITFAGTTVTPIDGSQGVVDLSVQGGTPSYTYSWTGPASFTATTQDISGLTAAGDYTVTVTDASSCTRDTTVFVADSHVMNAFLASSTDVSCNGGSNGSASIDVLNPAGTVTYTWTPNVSSTSTATNIPAADYHVAVYDGTTTAYVDFTIHEPSALSVSIARTNITCYNLNNGIADANPSGGILPYNYSWTKDAQPYNGNNETLIDLAEGTYAVTVTDANNCTANATQTVTNPGAITFTGTVTPVTCEEGKNDGIISLTNLQGGTGSFTYLWSNGLTTQNATLLAADNYSVTVTDANNCQSTNSYSVVYEAPIIFSPVVTDVACYGGLTGSINPNVSGGNSPFYYQWSTGSVSPTLSGIRSGSYTVTVTDKKFCQKSATISVTQPLSPLSIGSYTQNNVSCFGRTDGFVQLNAAGGTSPYFYQWDQGEGNASLASGLPAGTYHATVTDNNACTTNGTYNVTEPDALGLSENISSHTDLLCNGASTGEIELTPSGGSGNYQYSMNNGTWGPNPLFSGLTAGTYSFRVRDASVITCLYDWPQTVEITQPSAVTLGSPAVTDISCYGLTDGEITVSASGGTSPYTYALNVGGTASGNTSGLSSGIFTGLGTASDYTLQAMDNNGCTSSMSGNVGVAEPAQLGLSENMTNHADVLCNGGSTGVIEIVPSGGSGNYEYSMNSGAWVNSSTFNNLAAGSYSFSVRDANAITCLYDWPQSVAITQPSDVVTLGTPAVTDITCNGLTDGSISVNATGGTSPYTYALNLGGSASGNTSGASDGNFTGLGAGTEYTLQATDANNCTSAVSNQLVIAEPAALAISSATAQNATQNSPWNGSVIADVTGGTGSLSYTLTPGNSQGSGTFTNLQPGNYTVIITDANSCGPVTTSTLTVSDATSIINFGTSLLKIFPNPSHGMFTIQLSGSASSTVKVEIVSLGGQVVYQNEFTVETGKEVMVPVDISSHAKGLYLLKINGSVVKDKIILQ